MDKDIKNVGKFENAIQQSALNEYLYSFYQKDLPLVLEIVDEYIDDNKLSEVNLADIGNGPGSITQYLKENSKNTDKQPSLVWIRIRNFWIIIILPISKLKPT